MTTRTGGTLAEAGLDAAALKPAEVDVERATALAVDTLTVDYEGREHVPSTDTLAALAADHSVRVTTPVRADGYDPRGDDSLFDAIPEGIGRVVVAGHPAYLTETERRRAIAPRLREVTGRASDPWVGTEGIERLALTVGGTQYELLSETTERDVRALRAAGYDGDVAVYAPTVLAEDPDTILDAVGAYAARRPSVGEQIPADAPTDSDAIGRPRETLLAGCREFALVGDVSAVADRVDRLRDAGVDYVVGYPARGLAPLVG